MQPFVRWTDIERKCISLLQQTQARKHLLQIHSAIVSHRLQGNHNISSKFIYSCGSVAQGASHPLTLTIVTHARQMFDRLPCKDDTFLCNSMIQAHVAARQFDDAVALYRYLKGRKTFVPNNFTFTSLAKSCGQSRCLYEGLQMHSEVVKLGFCLDLYVSTALVDMYAKVGKLCFASNMFDEMTQRSLVSWTALIGGYVRSGNMTCARLLFDQMPEKDCAAYNAIIDGYVKVGGMDLARTLFDEMPHKNVITWTTMIHGYCNAGDVLSARFLFDSMPGKNLFSWNAMIGGYCQNKQPREAVVLFREMQSNTSLEPDEVTVVGILSAIADLGAVELGRWIHHYVGRKKLDRSTKVCTSLVDMYAKCGEITKARRVFCQIPKKDITTWNALINGLAVNGDAREAMQVFEDMQLEGVKPNDITMLGVLSACNHGGLLEAGRRWFEAMDGFELAPRIEHYGCMIDLLGRGGCLEEAENLMNSMPFEANGHLYAKDKRWGQVEEVKGLMKRNGAKKEAGSSAIEVDGEVSEFISGGREHPQWEEIKLVIGQLRDQM
ncbi:Pentatricopeptide repeat-containing protein At2g44880 [Linum grandiflorum]